MEQKTFSEEKMIGEIDASFDSVEKLRREGLEKVKLFHSVKNRALEREHTRLSDKLGADHPRVKKITARIQYNQSLFQDLDVEIEKANISVPSVDENNWMVHGRVLDRDRKGISGLTVGLFDEQGNWIRPLGYGCTNKRGYFSIIYPQKGKEHTDISESVKLFLYVSDNSYNILYKDSEPLYLRIGGVDYREIYLPEEDICTAPEPGSDDTMFQPETWVVKGRVTDESGRRGIGGVTVSLYDQDLLFDDRLGTTVTDEDGHFTMIYNTEDFRDFIEAKPDLYLKVLDKEGEELYASGKPVRYEAGHVEAFNIKIKKRTKK